MQQITLKVNGFDRTLLVEPHQTLLRTIRESLNLTGTKSGCDQGSCGACTVLVDGVATLACLTPAVRCDGKNITTIEGIVDGRCLHPVQEKFVEHGAIQCGYCTPGLVMTTVAFLQRCPRPTDTQIREAISGNLCRCTGYAKIVEAIRAASEVTAK